MRDDGSGRVTLRNRKFLRTFVHYSLQPAPRTDTARARLPAVKQQDHVMRPIPESLPVREIPVQPIRFANIPRQMSLTITMTGQTPLALAYSAPVLV